MLPPSSRASRRRRTQDSAIEGDMRFKMAIP
jgi:hypothetical protein